MRFYRISTILRKTFFSKEQQKNFKFFLRRNIECTPSFCVYGVLVSYAFLMRLFIAYLQHICNITKK